MKILRIVSCILACVCIAAAVPVGIFFDWYCLIPVAGAFIFGGVMFAARNGLHPKKEEPTHPDFMNTDEENDRLNKQ